MRDGLVARHRKHLQIHAKPVLQHAGKHEARHRHPDDHENHGQVVERLAAVQRGDDPEEKAEDDGDGHRPNAEVEGCRKALAMIVFTRRPRLEANSRSRPAGGSPCR